MNFAIIGYGKMGKIYDNLLRAEFIVDPLPVYNRPYFSNIEEFIYYHRPVDLVIVATPTYSHFEIVKKLLIAGYNVLCEKPICLSVIEAEKLEILANRKKLILYQSTLERYNPVVKFIKNNIRPADVDRVSSYRYGPKPSNDCSSDPKFDLGIHDIDLCFFLFRKSVSWELNTCYGLKKRELVFFKKTGEILTFDLLNKLIISNDRTVTFSETDISNPILEMINLVILKDVMANEKWSQEIKILEELNKKLLEHNNLNLNEISATIPY